MKIMIDCGHCLSGADTGAQGNGKREEILTREVGELVKTYLLQQGHQCELTEVNSGYSSVNASLQARIDKEKTYKPDLFVSIHFNKADTLAKAIVEGITGVKVENKPGISSQEAKLYKVICGAFNVVENANKRVEELKNKGFEAYVE